MDKTMMGAKTQLSGACLCGACRFKAATTIAMINNCHCTDCRRITGAVFGTLLWLPVEDVEMSGDFATFEHRADSGTAMTKLFCRTCGSQMFSRNGRRPHLIAARAGMIDQKDLVQPQFNVFCNSAIPSTPFDPALPRHARMPT
ncbi:MAG: GFA family protein [Sphingomonadales bacterium]|nr:GFA family protein [Sphingomonadales bacterium]